MIFKYYRQLYVLQLTACLVNLGIFGPLGCSAFWKENNMPCKNLGDFCRKLPFGQRCCGDTVCDLYAPFKGKCVRCLPPGKFCLRTKDCCQGKCLFFFCR
ncbi:hypothetical protein CLF_111444 [Clonorchis sinensis]|uniref:UPF0506 domain-containing protein n=1 Tax=Clonorchis sinensis TaxID=79923 RepID=G7YUW6_CLOSI|nr:hypothetical protein CLF_111444 [Clonorchis sinensis]